MGFIFKSSKLTELLFIFQKKESLNCLRFLNIQRLELKKLFDRY